MKTRKNSKSKATKNKKPSVAKAFRDKVHEAVNSDTIVTLETPDIFRSGVTDQTDVEDPEFSGPGPNIPEFDALNTKDDAIDPAHTVYTTYSMNLWRAGNLVASLNTINDAVETVEGNIAFICGEGTEMTRQQAARVKAVKNLVKEIKTTMAPSLRKYITTQQKLIKKSQPKSPVTFEETQTVLRTV